MAQNPYTIPKREEFSKVLLPFLASDVQKSMIESLKQQNYLTLSLDGWVDCSGISYYAVLLLKGPNTPKNYLGNLEFNLDCYTAVLIVDKLKVLLQDQLAISEHIKAFVSDSPSTMVAVRRMFSTLFPSVIQLRCCLHAFNLIAKDIIKLPLISPIVAKNLQLVTYFTKSSFWKNYLSKWATENNVHHGLLTYSETRWYSMIKVCLSVATYELGFKYCLDLSRDKSIDTADLSSQKAAIISDPDHFHNNLLLIRLLNPIIDSIGKLESSSANLGDIWREFRHIFRILRELFESNQFPERLHSTVQQTVDILNKRSIDFQEDIYVVSFFLCPRYRKIAVSKCSTIDQMKIRVLKIAKQWNYSKNVASALVEQVQAYLDNKAPFNTYESIHDQLLYWNSISCTNLTNELKKFAVDILKLVPHAASVESLFSEMSYAKKKWQNRMNDSTLTSMLQVKQFLLANNIKPPKKRQKMNEKDLNSAPNSFSTNEYSEVDVDELVSEFKNSETCFVGNSVSPTMKSTKEMFQNTYFNFEINDFGNHLEQENVENVEDDNVTWDISTILSKIKK